MIRHLTLCCLVCAGSLAFAGSVLAQTPKLRPRPVRLAPVVQDGAPMLDAHGADRYWFGGAGKVRVMRRVAPPTAARRSRACTTPRVQPARGAAVNRKLDPGVVEGGPLLDPGGLDRYWFQ